MPKGKLPSAKRTTSSAKSGTKARRKVNTSPTGAKRRKPANPNRKPVPTKRVPLDAMKDATFYHIIARGSKWAVHKHGSDRASGIYLTKSEAERAARDFKAINKHIIVHKRDGSVQKWIRSRAA